jgi:hypothetical protein
VPDPKGENPPLKGLGDCHATLAMTAGGGVECEAEGNGGRVFTRPKRPKKGKYPHLPRGISRQARNDEKVLKIRA